jgi:hypothetical protein
MSVIAIDRLPTEVQREVRKAERLDQRRYGPALLDGKQVFVDVTFYQGRQWWLQNIDGSNRRELTPELWQQIVEIAL